MKSERYSFEDDIGNCLKEDAEKIHVDLKFKKDLKDAIMKEKVVDIYSIRKKQICNARRYLKIASSFVICVLLGGGLYHLSSTPSNGEEYSTQEVEYKNKTITEVTKLREVSVDQIENVKNFKNDIFKTDSKNIDKPNNNNIDNSYAALEVVKNKSDKNLKKNSDLDQQKDKKKNQQVTEVDSDVVVAVNSEQKLELKDNENHEAHVDVKDESTVKVNDLLEKIKNKTALSTIEKPTGPVVVKPADKKDLDENEDNIQIYDASTSKDGLTEIKADENILYITTNDKKEIFLELEDGIKFENPNLLNSGNIIYARNKDADSNLSNIYLYDVSTKKEEKLFEGREPMISENGNMLAYEFKGELLIADLVNDVTRIVDKGNYPSWSYNGKYLSYVKEEIQYSKKAGNENKIEKICSSLWMYNLDNGDKYAITNKEFITDNKKIDSWAQEVRDNEIDTKYDIIPKYTYYESIWSIDDMKIYAIRRDNDKEVYDLVQFTLN